MRAALLFALAVPLLAGAGEGPSREKNRNRIESMTAAERARLERNFAHYKAMSESERTKYRTLDRQIRDDDAAGGGLRATMDEYVEWLSSLSPYERESIQKESNPTARAQLVRRIQMDQERQRGRPDEGQGPRFGGRPREGGWNWLQNLPRLSPADLDAVIAVVVEESRIPQPERDVLDALSPPERHLRVLSRAMEARPAPGGPRQNRWPDEALLGKMIDVIKNEPQKQTLSKLAEDRRRRLLGMHVAGALAAEWRTELEKQNPNEEALQKQFLELDPERRDELQLLSPEAQRRVLTFGVVSRENPKLRELIGVIQRLTRQFDRPREPRRGPDGRPEPPPDGRPDGRRGPPPMGRRGPPPPRERRAPQDRPDSPRVDGPDGP